MGKASALGWSRKTLRRGGKNPIVFGGVEWVCAHGAGPGSPPRHRVCGRGMGVSRRRYGVDFGPIGGAHAGALPDLSLPARRFHPMPSAYLPPAWPGRDASYSAASFARPESRPRSLGHGKDRLACVPVCLVKTALAAAARHPQKSIPDPSALGQPGPRVLPAFAGPGDGRRQPQAFVVSVKELFATALRQRSVVSPRVR